MKKWLLASLVILVIAVVGAVLVWTFIIADNVLKHDTDRWAVIQDVNGDRIAVEPISNQTWSQLSQLYSNKSVRFVGGIVETYDNKWGFRFKPENVTIAQFTAEGLQATIKYISQNLDYWLGGWAYVSATVTEIHGY
jgi:hypothetical protein